MLLDTSVIIELLRRPPTHPVVGRIRKAIGDRPMFASPIHMGELADAARRDGVDVESAVAKALQIVDLIPLDARVAVQASSIKAEARKRQTGKEFSLIDGVGLASARSREMGMLTMDNEFAPFLDVTVIKR
jgi:predicted nucleic acid-binding protein